MSNFKHPQEREFPDLKFPDKTKTCEPQSQRHRHMAPNLGTMWSMAIACSRPNRCPEISLIFAISST
jgi:hypothetical protein